MTGLSSQHYTQKGKRNGWQPDYLSSHLWRALDEADVRQLINSPTTEHRNDGGSNVVATKSHVPSLAGYLFVVNLNDYE